MKNWLAQVFPSSPVSVGTFPSNRTLEVGEGQEDVASRFRVTPGQPPVADDPLTASVPSVGNLKLDGITRSVCVCVCVCVKSAEILQNRWLYLDVGFLDTYLCVL